MLIYTLIFLIISFLAVEYEIGNNKSKLPFYLIVLFLALFAGFRAPDVARDYQLYMYAFDNIGSYSSVGDNFWATYEPGFMMVVFVFKWIFTSYYTLSLMLFFAFAALTLKAKAILDISINPFAALLVYYSTYYLLHEMTQIRIGLASAIFLFSVPYFIQGKHLKFIVTLIVAGMFHYSAFLFFGIYLFKKNYFNKTWFFVLLISSIPLAFLKLPLDNAIRIFYDTSQGTSKIATYSTLMEYNYGKPINIFNALSVSKFFICVYLIFIIPMKDLIEDKYLSLFLKLVISSVFILYLTSGIPAFSFRLSDLFGIGIIFLYPYLSIYLPFKKFNVWVIVFISAVYFYLNVYYSHLLNPYHIFRL